MRAPSPTHRVWEPGPDRESAGGGVTPVEGGRARTRILNYIGYSGAFGSFEVAQIGSEGLVCPPLVSRRAYFEQPCGRWAKWS